MKVKFITVKGSGKLGRAPFYVGIPQHERTMSRREAYEHIAAATGYTPTSPSARALPAAQASSASPRPAAPPPTPCSTPCT